MLVSKKIRLILTPEQQKYCWRAAGTARWAYNQYLARRRNMYAEHKADKSKPSTITAFSFNKEVTQLKKAEEYTWLKEIAACVTKTAVLHGEQAYNRFFKGLSEYPQFHSKKNTKPSFAMQPKSFSYQRNGCKIENLGFVQTAEPIPKKPKGSYKNVTISYDNKYWYVSFSYEIEPEKVQLNDFSVGIDLGIKVLAVVATTDKKIREYKNINKTSGVRRTEKRLKRIQRALSRKIKSNTTGYTVTDGINKYGKACKIRKSVFARPLKDCKNFRKNTYLEQRLFRRLRCIRDNYIHQITTEIVKTKPSRIVMENLNVRGMMKNKHLAKAIAEQKFYEFRRQIEYKCEKYGIEFVLADRFYASSKTCSHCGHIKTNLKLSDRIYKCTECGLEIDRDLNAAINLANYKTA